MNSFLCLFQDFLKYYSKAGRDVEKLQVWTQFLLSRNTFSSFHVLINIFIPRRPSESGGGDVFCAKTL